jgi:hypothetical protein
MWCAIAMPPYGGFFLAVDPLQKHFFRGSLKWFIYTVGLAEFRFWHFGRANGHDRSMHRQKGVISVLLLEAV